MEVKVKDLERIIRNTSCDMVNVQSVGCKFIFHLGSDLMNSFGSVYCTKPISLKTCYRLSRLAVVENGKRVSFRNKVMI